MTAVITGARDLTAPRHSGVACGPASIAVLMPGDAADLLAMHERCSPRTRLQRWHGHVRVFPATYLAALTSLTGQSGDQLAIAARRGAEVIGFASAGRVDEHTRELGILVEDRCQRRGVGRQLLDALIVEAVANGTRTLRAEVMAEQAALLDLLGPLGPMSIHRSWGLVRATVDLPAS
jgi:ribosomal protein S18 acetylase RimI-like enzyme